MPLPAGFERPGSSGTFAFIAVPRARGDRGAKPISDRKVAWEEMATSIPRCQKIGLEVIACADDLAEAETLAKLSPEYIAIEPPELIGGDVSVTTAKPEVITKAVDRIRAANPNVNVLCGAGVRARKDVAKALELGTVGVLLSSGVVKARDPEKALRDLVKGLR